MNRGIARARYSHVCLLNNDMLIEPGFFGALREAFDRVPDLFCASAQIRFPPGVRREETGKTVMARHGPLDFPIRCDEPLAAEDHTYVLYGSGGCSLYDASKLRALGGVDEAYQPAYVEDLDLGYRAWRRGWPTVYAAGAVVEHRHRATTSRYFTADELERILEINYLKFLARSVGDAALFRRLWAQATLRLRLLAGRPAARAALRAAPALALAGAVRQSPAAPGAESEPSFLALTDGSVALFPGRPPSAKPRVLVVSPYLPFPLAHGGAVRMYNLMRRAAADFDQVLVAFSETLAEPPPEALRTLHGDRSGAPRGQPFPALHRPSRGGRRVRFPGLPRRSAPDRAEVASRAGAARVHPDGAVRPRLRPRAHHPGGTRHHLRPLRAIAGARGSTRSCAARPACGGASKPAPGVT